MTTLRRLLALAGLLATMACQNAEDRAAKERVFSPPPPDPFIQKAKEKLEAARIATDDAVRLRAFSQLFPEVAARARAGRFDVQGSMALGRGAQTVTVNETGHIRFNTHGDMDVELRTGPTEATQLIFCNDVIYLRNRAGSWRASRDPTDERHYWADNAYSSLRSITEMFNPAMSLAVKGKDQVDGRTGTLLEVTFKGAPRDPGLLAAAADGGPPPGTRLPDGGVLHQAAQDRRRAMKGGEPQSITGTVVWDDEAGVPLKVELEAVMKLPGRRTTDANFMTLKTSSTLTHVGKDEDIEPPKEAVEEIVRRRVPVNPLEFLDAGAGGKGKKAPVVATPPPEEEEAESP
ncbi:MAG: hypothetical protein HY904_07205 [Deltaproteobacteria bacterium]|nr:hypothetical protein [Deltaproteobacteria bacterium]